MTEDVMMQEYWDGFMHHGYFFNENKTCALCGELWHIDDMDEEYPDCCKSCVEDTSQEED